MRGDHVLLGEGDRVPADVVRVQAVDVETDESLLTGESVPIGKRAADRVHPVQGRPGGDDQPFVYSGSLVVRGAGGAYVTAIGPRGEIGKIGQSLCNLEAEPQPLQRQTPRLVRFCALGGAVVSVLR